MEQRIDLTPTRFAHAEVAVLLLELAEGLGRVWSLGAVQIEQSAQPKVPRSRRALVDAKAVEHLDLQAREEGRDPVARNQHRIGVPLDDVARPL